SSGQCDLIFRSLPGEKISVRFPANKRYSPTDTSIILNRGQNSFNISATKEPVKISLIPIDSLGDEKTAEVENLEIIFNNYLFRTKKSANKFDVITNMFDPADELRVNISSPKYENRGESIKLNQIDKNVYEGKFYVKPKEEHYVVKDINKEPGEGILILDSEPKEAKIYIDHVAGNYTPDTLKLFEGIHTIELKKEGYLSAPVVVEIKPDSIIKPNIELVGPITPLQKISSWLKISTDLSVLGLFMEYPSGNVYPFPTFRVGGHFFPIYNPDCGLKISYLASKIPTYYTSQEFGLGLFLGKKRFHWLIGIKESNFESFKSIDSRFAGSSVESYLTICVDSDDRARERLLFLNQHSMAMVFGYERSFESMNKSVAGQFKKEQELYGGFMFRWKRGLLNFRFGIIEPKLTVIDIEKKPKNVDIKLYRLFVSYNYFLN
ncbi:MAG TPA: PEGA domain-containing protein, partial [Candidatus Lokiarchaeia archaeon]